MSTKPKQPVIKGQEAEDKVAEYMKKMNRPYGAVDVAANLKGAIPKAAVQKILLALAEKGDLTQKVYGKTTFFVYNQAKIDSLPNDKVAALKAELTALEEENKVLATQVKALSTDLVKVKATPTDIELDARITEAEDAVSKTVAALLPLRSGAPPISKKARQQLEADWIRWRAEWIHRRKVFMTFWQLATDALPPQDAHNLKEDLGIEMDSEEHMALEKSQSGQLKRKRG